MLQTAPRAAVTTEPAIDWATLRAALPNSRYRFVREVVDRVVAALLLVVLLPLMLVIAAAVRLDSPGPVFFRQRRAGRYAQPFTIVKFRTMSVLAPKSSLKVSDDDPRVTRVGRLLRRSGLDEIPQLWNVLKGEMAVIGPRPEQIALMGYYQPWHHERHLIKPGVTGWWQVHHRDSVPMHLNIDKDLHYVRFQSLALDAAILARTMRIALVGLLVARRSPGLPARRRQPYSVLSAEETNT